MDEATGHLDYTTDDAVQAYLERVFRPSTVICVTHRRKGFPSPDYSIHLVEGNLDAVLRHTARAVEVTNQYDSKAKRCWRQ